MFPCSQAQSYLSYLRSSLKAFLVQYAFDYSLNRVSRTILILPQVTIMLPVWICQRREELKGL